MASDYCVGKHRYRIFPLSQKVLLANVAYSLRRATHRKKKTRAHSIVWAAMFHQQKAGDEAKIKGDARRMLSLIPGSEGALAGCFLLSLVYYSYCKDLFIPPSS